MFTFILDWYGAREAIFLYENYFKLYILSWNILEDGALVWPWTKLQEVFIFQEHIYFEVKNNKKKFGL